MSDKLYFKKKEKGVTPLLQQKHNSIVLWTFEENPEAMAPGMTMYGWQGVVFLCIGNVDFCSHKVLHFFCPGVELESRLLCCPLKFQTVRPVPLIHYCHGSDHTHTQTRGKILGE